MTAYDKGLIKTYVSEGLLRNSFPWYKGNLDELAEKLGAEMPLSKAEAEMALWAGITLIRIMEDNGLKEVRVIELYTPMDNCGDEFVHSLYGVDPDSPDNSPNLHNTELLHLKEFYDYYIWDGSLKAYKFPTGCSRDYGFDRVLIKEFYDYLKPISNSLADRGLIDEAPDSARKAYDEYCRCEEEAGRLYCEFEARVEAEIKKNEKCGELSI